MVFLIDFMNSSLQSGYPLKSVSQIPIIIFSISLLYAIDDAIYRKRRFLPGTNEFGKFSFEG